MSSPPEMALPLGSQLPTEIPTSPSAMRRQLLEAGEADLGPTGVPTAALAKHWLDAYSGFVNVYMNPLLNPVDDVWLPPRAYILLLEAATVLVLRLKDFRSLFAPKAAKIIPSLLVFYVLLDGYEASDVPDYDENSSVSGARMQELIFEALVLYLLSLGDRVKSRAKNGDALEEEDLLLSTTLEALLNASDEILLKRETMLYPCTVPMLTPGRIHTRLDDEEAVPVDHILLRNERQAALLPSFFTSVVAAVLARQFKTSDFLMSTLSAHSARTSRSAFMSLISGCWPVAPAKVADYAALMMSNMHSFASCHNSSLLEDVYSDLRHQLLLYRIGVKDSQPRAQLDTVLDTCLYSSRPASPAADCLSVLRRLTQADVDDRSLTVLVGRYLTHAIPLLDRESLHTLRDGLPSGVAYEAVHEAINHQTSKPKLAPVAMDVDDAAPSSRRNRIVSCLRAIFIGKQDAGLEDVDNVVDSDLAAHVLWLVDQGFPESLDKLPVEAQVESLKALVDLPCLVVGCETPECHRWTGSGGISILSAYTPLLLRVSDGDGVNPSVRKLVYKALASAIRHHAPDAVAEGPLMMGEAIMTALSNRNRSVRLAAGRALAECVLLYELVGTEAAARQAERFFDACYRLLSSNSEIAKETTLITVGAIAKATTSQSQCVAVCCLVSQLSNPSPTLKGIACTQIMSLAGPERTVYRALSPYIDQIAEYTIRHWCTQPTILAEFCHTVNVKINDFVRLHLKVHLPKFFADRQRHLLAKISTELDIKPHKLLLEIRHEALAHVFLLPTKDQSDRSLEFVVKYLSESAHGPIGAQTLIKGCLAELLASLVTRLGDVDEKVVQAATEALRKVDQILTGDRKRQRSGQLKGDPKGLLRLHLLSITSQMTDLLQEIKYKASVDLKKRVLRSFGELAQLLGQDIGHVAPQIMLAFQAALGSELSDYALESWRYLLHAMAVEDIAPHLGFISAVMVDNLRFLTARGTALVHDCLKLLVITLSKELQHHFSQIPDLDGIPELVDIQHALRQRLRQLNPTSEQRVTWMLERAKSDNMSVVHLALRELKLYMVKHHEWIQTLALGDLFRPLVGHILSVVLSAATRDSDGADAVRRVAYECIGALGAVDPDRCDLEEREQPVVVVRNFVDQDENAEFATHLIANVLVPAFRSTGIIVYQKHLSYAMQELSTFCRFTPALVSHSTSTAVTQRVRRNWQVLTQKNVLDVVTPLLDSKFKRIVEAQDVFSPPFYSAQPTYREWLATWTSYLVSRTSEGAARTIFGHIEHTISKDDVSVAYHLLPHLVLNVILSREPSEIDIVRTEILAVLEDQVNPSVNSARDKRLLSAQAVFLLMDHIQKWLRFARTTSTEAKQKNEGKRREAPGGGVAEQIARVDSIVTSIDQNLVAEAAFRCKAYARSLMSFEQHVVALRARRVPERQLQHCYDRIHEIYANLDDADGMAGISTLILQPSLEHQIREHESNGRWTSAQSCWELSLQQSPDNMDCHKGLLQCLRHLGHYDTLRTHVKGLLVSKPEWKADLVDFQVEGAWNAGAWEEVRSLVADVPPDSAQMAIARVLVAMQANDQNAISIALDQARMVLGEPISAAGPHEYRRTYDSVLSLHAVHEMETIQTVATTLAPGSRQPRLANLSRNLRLRLDATQPSYRVREPLLSMRRVVFALCSPLYPELGGEIGKVWLTSAKFARKAGHMSAAYSALIQAQHRKTPYTFIQDAKLVKATGDSSRALREIEHSIRLAEEADAAVIDLTAETENDADVKLMMAKAELLRCRWAQEEDKFTEREVVALFNKTMAMVPRYESASFYCGKYHDAMIKPFIAGDSNRISRAARLRVLAVRSFMKAIKYGSKFTYQSVPRLLTIWLDMGEDAELRKTESFSKVMGEINRILPDIPAYKWYTAFPQITSRVGHQNSEVWKSLSKIISQVIVEYPQQALWQFAPVVKSRNNMRSSRGKQIITQLQATPASEDTTELRKVVNENMAMVAELLRLCDLPIAEKKYTLSMKKDVPSLMRLAPSRLILPLQESLVASLPPASSEKDSAHKPFPTICPTFAQFHDEIEVMRSLARPRKITILGSDGKDYMFLGKPKDDLRKDARLMDFNALINKLLKANSESRRRQLHIRTYAVVTLNEECGFIQWVPKTTPVRPVLNRLHAARGAPSFSSKLEEIYNRMKAADDKAGGEIYVKEVLPLYPSVFHEWYLETFPEPSSWLAARRTYGRTLAVMSIVGWVLGLGDRHTENILLDENTGAAIHVDFCCLFERGKLLETPERVPFRLTHNMVDALGIVGVEGVFRNACEVSFEILRDNSDTLMSVLDAFVHDPLVEWEDEKRRQERYSGRKAENAARATADLKALAHNALDPIQSKLSGTVVMSVGSETRKLSAKALVEVLIQEATDPVNLGKMYPGWGSWM